MNVKSISRTVGLILLITGIFQLFPLLIAVIDHEPRNILAYIESLCLILLVGSALLLFSRGGNRMFSAQEGFAATGLSWIFMSAFGALPFFLSGQIPSYVDAFFEMVSGFTTTGASILTDVEALSRCNLFWRSFSHWLGGMGVLVFLLAVVPGARKNGGTGIYLCALCVFCSAACPCSTASASRSARPVPAALPLKTAAWAGTATFCKPSSPCSCSSSA